MKKISALGKCYKRDGYYGLFNIKGEGWAIYILDEDAKDAVLGGYLSDPENFEIGVEELKEETNQMLEDMGFPSVSWK